MCAACTNLTIKKSLSAKFKAAFPLFPFNPPSLLALRRCITAPSQRVNYESCVFNRYIECIRLQSRILSKERTDHSHESLSDTPLFLSLSYSLVLDCVANSKCKNSRKVPSHKIILPGSIDRCFPAFLNGCAIVSDGNRDIAGGQETKREEEKSTFIHV